MAEYRLRFNKIVNNSLQVGDIIYRSTTSIDSNGNEIASTPDLTGEVIRISGSRRNIFVDITSGAVPSSNDFIMFQKNRQVNESGLKGYFAEAVFTNGSSIKAELFDIGVEATYSSK